MPTLGDTSLALATGQATGNSQRRDRVIDAVPGALQFGKAADDSPEILVLYGIFGLQLFYYDELGKAYREKPPEALWEVPLSLCARTEHPHSIPWPGGWGVEDYTRSGFNSLGYIAAVLANPQLAQYLDNPGLLVLLIANPQAFTDVAGTNLKRVELLQAITGHHFLGRRHLKWLRRVRPGGRNASAVATNITRSLLRLPSARAGESYTRRTRAFLKLFSHQRQWTPEGLELARILLASQVDDPGELSWLLSARNGDVAPGIARCHKALGLLLQSQHLPNQLNERLNFYRRNPDSVTPAFVARLEKAVLDQVTPQYMAIAQLFLSDEDIPRPVVSGNEHVRHLGTLASIRQHALEAGNCLWTLDIIAQVIAGRIDLYVLRGERLCTFAVNRQTLDIRTLESAGGAGLAPPDLRTIGEWFEQSTRLPRPALAGVFGTDRVGATIEQQPQPE
jgi:hypothetical protein